MIRLLGLSVLLVSMSLAVFAQEPQFQAGTHYQVLGRPLHTADPDKIEVLEFFWYGCGHCYTFEPMIQQWKKGIAEDVDFVGSPAIWNEPMAIHARAYYTAKAMGVLEVMHNILFAAMNVDRKRLASEQELAQLFAANGVAEEQFKDVFNSFGVTSQVSLAGSRGRNAKITGTPEMLVAGKYRISARTAGGQAQMLEVADFLIERERASR